MTKDKKPYLFKNGLKKNSLLIILLAALIAVSLCFWVDRSIKQGDYLRLSRSQFILHGFDYTSKTTYNVYQLNHTERNNPRVLSFGGSSSYFVLDNGAVTFADYLATKSSDVDFVSLTFNGQSMIEILNIVNDLPNGEGVAVIGVNPRDVKPDFDLTRIPIDRSKTIAFIKKNGYESYQDAFLHNFIFGDLFKRVFDKLFYATITNIEPSSDPGVLIKGDFENYRFDDDYVANVKNRIHEELQAIDQNAFDCFDTTLDEIARVLNEKGYALLLVNLPISEDLYEGITFGDESLLTVFNRHCDSLAMRYDSAYYTTFSLDMDITEMDFTDGYHIGNPEKLDTLRRKIADIAIDMIDLEN